MNKLTLRLSLLTLTLALCSALSAQTYPLGQQDPAANGFTSTTLGTVDFNWGWRFKVNSADVTVLRLGCNFPDGATVARTVTLFDVATQQVLGQAICGPGTGWQFTDLTAPVTLVNGSEYVIAGVMPGSNPLYSNGTPPTSWVPTGTIEFLDNQYAITTSPNIFPSASNASWFGVIDFGYTTSLTVATAPQLPNAGDLAAYSQDIEAVAGTTPYSWSYSGTLPTGLSLTQVGNVFRLAGTPASGTPNSYTFDVTVADSTSASHTRTMTLEVDGLLVVNSLADGTAGSAYAENIQAVNGTKPYTWSLVSGTLPTGLSLTQVSNDFKLSGTPASSSVGAYNLEVNVTDSLNATATVTITFYIDAPAGSDVYPMTKQDPTSAGFSSFNTYGSHAQWGWKFKVNSIGINILRLGSNFMSGGTVTVTLWDVATQQILAQEVCGPGAGWQFTNLATPVALANGSEYVIVGNTATPSTAYWHTNLPAQWKSTGDVEWLNGQHAFTSVASPNVFPTSTNATRMGGVVDFGYFKPLTVSTDSVLQSGEEQVSYTANIQAESGTTPYTWSMVSGVLPSGLSLAQVGNDFQLAGTPAIGTPAPYTFDVKVTDAIGDTHTKTMTINITWPASAYTYPLTQQNPATTGFSSTSSTSSRQYGWRFKVNSDGLTIYRLGSNFPSASSSVARTATLFDYTSQAILAQVVCPPGSGWQWRELTTPVALANGSEYIVAVHTSNGYYYDSSVTTPWAPTGDIEYLSARYASTTSSDTFPLYSYSGSRQFGVVDFGYIKSLSITTNTMLPTAAEQTSYSTNLQADFGTTPYTWTLVSGNLPNGLSLTAVGDEFQLAGTPATGTIGNYTFAVKVTDANNSVHTKQMSLYVSPQPVSMPFTDDFSADQGWQYGADWSRGSATAWNPTSGGIANRSEPGADNSSSADNNIAGHIIGGDYATNMFVTVWLTSPPVNCSNATFVSLQFYRWLGVSLDSTAAIEVTNDGVNWVNVWTSPTFSNTQDATWEFIAHDITAVAAGNAVVQVRFGIGPTSTSTGTVNVGWCIDDVQIIEPGPELEVREGGLTGTLIIDDEAVGGLRDFGQIDDTSFSIITIALANTSPSTVTISYSITQSGSGNFAFVNGQPPTSLAPNSSTTFDVMFLPQTTGVYNGTVLMTHSASYSGNNPFSINLRGEGVVAAPVIQVDLAAFGGTNIPHQDSPTVANTRDFGSVLVNGNSAPIDVAITNVGNTPLTITTIRIIGTWWNQFSLNSGTVPVTLAPNSSITVSVAFQPTVPGIKDAYIEIAHNGTANPTPYEVAVLGTAVAAVPLIDVDDSSGAISHNDTTIASTPRDFGNILVGTNSAPLTVTVSNNGGSDLTVGAPALTTGASEYSLDLTNFGSPPVSIVIPVNSSITFDVIFTPTSAGVKDAQIEFTHNDNTVTSPFIINVTGTGVQAAPVIAVSNGTTVLANPDTLDFGSRDVAAGPTAAVVISIENTGTAVLILGTPVFNPASSNFILNTTGLPSSLSPNANTTFSITFDPTQEGALTAVIEFSHNDGSTATPYVLNLTGIGIAPKIEVREGSITGAVVVSGATATSGSGRDLGAIDISAGATGPVIISLQNSGSLVLTLGTPTIVGSNAADFTLNTTGMATSLTVGADTSFTITFDPTLGGLKDAQIVFTHNDPTNPSPFIVPITGTAVDPNGVQITTTSLPQGTDSTLYIAVQLTAIQGSAPYTWSVYNGNLPDGLTLSSSGLITGTPTSLTTNTYNFTVRVTDTTGATHEKALQIFVAGSAIANLGFGNAGCAAGAGSQTWILILAMLSIAAASFKRRKRASE